ncbi:hypothetical protein E8E11_002819 [Didymella keratinophila]|nr:hypothetical protein E8E11_002819 [Didymella keratinophila]
MHFSALAILIPLLAATPLASAWKLQIFMNDGRSVTTHGRLDSGCETYGFDMSSPVTKVKFEDSLVTETFELYTKKNCQGPKILSYKAY